MNNHQVSPSLATDVRGNVRVWLSRGVLSILAFEFFWGVGFAVTNLSTVVTGYIRDLGFSEMIVGLVPASFGLAYGIIQPLSLAMLRPGQKFFRNILILYTVGSLGFMAMGLLVIYGRTGSWAGLCACVLSIVAFSVFVGLADPHYVSILFCAAPGHLRGRFFGPRTLSFGIGGWLGGMGLYLVFKLFEGSARFGVAFLAGGLLFFASVISFSIYNGPFPRETPSPVQVVPVMRKLWAGVMKNRVLRTFLIHDALFVTACTGGFPLCAGHIGKLLGTGQESLPALTSANVVALCIFGLILGWLTDRAGYRGTMLLVMTVFTIGSSILLFSNAGIFIYVAAFFLASIWLPGLLVTHFNLAQACAGDFSPAETMVVLSIALLPFRLLSPLLVGFLFDQAWSSMAIVFCITMTLLSAAILGFGIKPEDLRKPSL